MNEGIKLQIELNADHNFIAIYWREELSTISIQGVYQKENLALVPKRDLIKIIER